MKYLSVLFLTLLTGCSSTVSRPPKSCYLLTLNFNGVNSKQILCTNKPLKESYNFKKLPPNVDKDGFNDLRLLFK